MEDALVANIQLIVILTTDTRVRILNKQNNISRAQAFTKSSTLASSCVKENVFPNKIMVWLWKILFLMIILLSPMMLQVDYSVQVL